MGTYSVGAYSKVGAYSNKYGILRVHRSRLVEPAAIEFGRCAAFPIYANQQG